ncbi:MAG: TRAP transporter large permease subunit [Alphaproteobacteria bacterium]|nr:TRAP transporter large permease subunit [Alphaproteobacteria bacterium]
MSDVAIGFLGFAAILVLIAIRLPIGLALGLVAVGGLWALVGSNTTLSLLSLAPFEFAAKWELSSIPMFLVMGTLAFHAGMTTSLYRVARMWLGFLPGGLAVASNFACAAFSAASGSSLATTIAMGRIAIPEMLRFRYDPGLATGVVASAGTLGTMIPPSVLMILYGVFAEVSIAKLFIAGILPGLLIAAVYAAMVIVRCAIDPRLAPPIDERVPLRARIAALAEVWPLPVLILAVIGGLYGGIVTPTEAGAFGAVVAAVIAAIQRTLTWKVLKASVLEALEGTAAIFFIAIGAVLLTRFMAFSGVPDYLTRVMIDVDITPLLVVAATFVIYLILGCFLEPIGLMLLTLPVLLPIFDAVDLHPIWIGILIVKFVEIGLLTPPVGLNVYAAKTIVGDAIPLETIFKGVGWFLVCDMVVVAVLVAFPDIVLYLPRQM